MESAVSAQMCLFNACSVPVWCLLSVQFGVLVLAATTVRNAGEGLETLPEAFYDLGNFKETGKHCFHLRVFRAPGHILEFLMAVADCDLLRRCAWLCARKRCEQPLLPSRSLLPDESSRLAAADTPRSRAEVSPWGCRHLVVDITAE